jgi:hypothetical protein
MTNSAPQRDVLVATLYQQGVPVAEIADRAGVCVKTVRNVARRFELPPRNPPNPERDARAIARYASGEKVTAIARELGISRSRIRLLAAGAGLPPRSDWQRRYPLDETAFDHPTNVGWWLIGLLAADGSIHAAEHRVTLCQTLGDADVLYAFYDYVGCPNRPLTMLNLSKEVQQRQYPRRPAAEARIFSRRIVRALARHGIVPGKTATTELSSEAASNPAVWLGLLDGDGSVGIYRHGRDVRVRFAGTRQVMTQCERFWRGVVPFDASTPAAHPHSRGIWVFDLAGAKARRAAEVLLAASPVSMARKRAKLSALVADSSLDKARGGGCRAVDQQASSETKGDFDGINEFEPRDHHGEPHARP